MPKYSIKADTNNLPTEDKQLHFSYEEVRQVVGTITLKDLKKRKAELKIQKDGIQGEIDLINAQLAEIKADVGIE